MLSNESEILVVDDIEDNRYTLERRLKRDGYENITLVDGGAAALELINERQFDLVLLDLMMPEISGLDVLKNLKSDPLHRNIPVIMVTAADEVETAAECITVGADDFITKPFNKTLLRARVAASLEKKKLRDQEAIYLSRIEKDKRKSLDLVRSFLPKSAASEIKSLGKVTPRRYEDVAILICDLVGFTKFCENNSPETVVEELESVFGLFEKIYRPWVPFRSQHSRTLIQVDFQRLQERRESWQLCDPMFPRTQNVGRFEFHIIACLQEMTSALI